MTHKESQNILPDYVRHSLRVRTIREWKKRKRAEIRAVERAVNTFRLGCAFTPGYPNGIDVLYTAISALKKELSVKNWGA